MPGEGNFKPIPFCPGTPLLPGVPYSVLNIWHLLTSKQKSSVVSSPTFLFSLFFFNLFLFSSYFPRVFSSSVTISYLFVKIFYLLYPDIICFFLFCLFSNSWKMFLFLWYFDHMSLEYILGLQCWLKFTFLLFCLSLV